MISLQEIKKYYPNNLHYFNNFLLREYLQYKILEIVFDSAYAEKFCFFGGTCLRIVHNNTRFSEDLDFDNFNISEVDFEKISEIIMNQLLKQGYQVEIRNVYAGAYHCYIKVPKLLFDEGLSGYIEEKILIQLDTEPQHFNFVPEKIILNKFDVFTSINCTPLDILLSQKFYALINRKRKKGRDLYDILFLLNKAKPNYDYLAMKLGINNAKSLKIKVMESLDQINLIEMADDVSPFLFDINETKKIKMFTAYINQTL